MEFFRKTNFNFMARRKFAISMSVLLILIGIASLIVKKGPAYNIDFLGGTELQIQFHQSEAVQSLRNVLTKLNYPNAEIKEFGDRRDFDIRFKQQDNATLNPDHILTSIQQAFPKDEPQLLSNTSIGPRIGRELRQSAIWAVLISLILILLYVGFRFEFTFAVGAVIALFHDVMITLGFCSLANIEISLPVLAAFLTLVGYSLNDTIVVFDRIRENLARHRRGNLSIDQIINLSINETLSRTILTSGTTLVVVVIGTLFGGEVLRGFFLCLLVGILVGTYSSIFIASPIVIQWYSKRRAGPMRPKVAPAA